MELELGLALPDPGGPKKACFGQLGVGFDGTKRGFGEAIGAGGKATLLPLFVSGSDGDDGERRGGGDDDGERTNKRKRLVGWPPVKCAHHRRGAGSGYVKVKMEGVAIGRKVDVSLHASYDHLRRTLDRMFPPPSSSAGTTEDDGAGVGAPDRLRQRRHAYVVTYEDGEGD